MAPSPRELQEVGEGVSQRLWSVDIHDLLERVFQQYRPEIVSHAAAHKHMPLMENTSEVVVKNHNIFGTLDTALLADRYGAKRFVLVSTDKALNLTNVMGAIKRRGELIIQLVNERGANEYPPDSGSKYGRCTAPLASDRAET